MKRTMEELAEIGRTAYADACNGGEGYNRWCAAAQVIADAVREEWREEKYELECLRDGLMSSVETTSYRAEQAEATLAASTQREKVMREALISLWERAEEVAGEAGKDWLPAQLRLAQALDSTEAAYRKALEDVEG